MYTIDTLLFLLVIFNLLREKYIFWCYLQYQLLIFQIIFNLKIEH